MSEEHKERQRENTLEQKDILTELLESHVLDVEFVKVNGERRAMTCTLIDEFIPTHKRYFDNDKENRQSNPGVLAVFDMEKEDWRSFRVDSVYSYAISGTDEVLYDEDPDQLKFTFEDVPF
jgi:hypothetical protein